MLHARFALDLPAIAIEARRVVAHVHDVDRCRLPDPSILAEAIRDDRRVVAALRVGVDTSFTDRGSLIHASSGVVAGEQPGLPSGLSAHHAVHQKSMPPAATEFLRREEGWRRAEGSVFGTAGP